MSRLKARSQSMGGRAIFGIVVRTALVVASMSTLSAKDSLASIAFEASRIGDASHFEFTGGSDWKYELKRNKESADEVILHLKDLDASAIDKLKRHKDSLIQSVTVRGGGVDGAFEVRFKTASGTDFFDYLTSEPSRLVVDFFPKEPANVSDEESNESEKAKPATRKRSEAGSNDKKTVANTLPLKNDKRAPAGTDFVLVEKGVAPGAAAPTGTGTEERTFNHGIFDGGDPEFRRFSIKDYEISESAIRASRANFYLPFPMLELDSPQLKGLLSRAPVYEIVPNEKQENKEAQLILTLFSKNRRALLLKTGEEFIKKYPHSPYDEIIRYMMADTHYKLWRSQGTAVDFEKAMNYYRYLTETYPDSPATARTLLLVGYAYVDRGDSFSALKAFQRFVRSQPNSKYLDQVNISIAEAYLKLNRFDDAHALLDRTEKSAQSPKVRQDAAFRKGDVFFRKKSYSDAIKSYQEAIAKYPAAAGRFPNAWYNMAEAEFIQSKFRESLEAYRLFLTKFPDHEHGGYAMTRMGELLEVLGAEKKRATGAFFESYFRYRATPGAGIARIRILTSRMPEMKEKELASALEEIEEITLKYSDIPSVQANAKDVVRPKEEAGVLTSELDDLPKRPELPGISEFSVLQIADGFTERREYDNSTARLVAYYQKYPQSPNKEKFKARIVRNLTESVHAALEKGDFIEALRRYSANAGGWLKNSDRVDLKYYIGRSYELAGVFKEASTIYADILDQLKGVNTSGGSRDHNIFEIVPKTDAIQLRLASVAAKDKDFAEAEKHLKKIPNVALLTEPEQIERAEISAEVAEARGQAQVARKYLADLVKAWKGEPELTGALHLRIARLLQKEKDFKGADEHLMNVIELRKGSGRVSDEIFAKALEQRGDLLLERGMRKEAVESYRELLSGFESAQPLGAIRYRVGQILFEDGDLKQAEIVWSEFKPDDDGVWRRLAAEQMQGAKWQNEYKRYLERIPAAADLRASQAAGQ